MGGCYFFFFFGMCVWIFTVSFFSVSSISRENEAMCRASCLCLVAGLLTARTCRKVAQVTPSCMGLGSGTDPQADFGSA